MAVTVQNGQTCLEIRGIEEREQEIVKSHYSSENPYGAGHPDAISDGDVLGKGTNHGGHTHWLPDCTQPKTKLVLSNFDTTNGGGKYDIEGRNDIGGRRRALAMSMYNKDYEYGSNLVNTEANRNQGQFFIK